MDFKLVVKDLVKQFKQGAKNITVLQRISLEFLQGKSYALAGASGSGKSTFMHLCAGLDVPSSGSVQINHTDLYSYPAYKRAQLVVLVTQKPLLIKELTVLENAMLAGTILNIPQHEVQTKARHYLKKVGLEGTEQWNVGSLSGGQQQRLTIARALLVKPAFLLADEPTGALDEHTGADIISLLLSCQREYGMGLIVSSHNPAVIAVMEEALCLADGFLQGSPSFPKIGEVQK